MRVVGVVLGGDGGRGGGGEVGVEGGVRAGEVLEEVGEAWLVHVDVGWGGVFGLVFLRGYVSWVDCNGMGRG